MTRPLAIDVFDYLDFRVFLRDCYRDLKEHQRGFSYRWFAREAGMSSPNFLKLVMDGKRNLSAQSIDSFARVLKLTESEVNYFRCLVAFAQAESVPDKNAHFERLCQLRRRPRATIMTTESFDVLTHWYYVAIAELVDCPGFTPDPAWIAATLVPSISEEEAAEALRVLLAHGVLQRLEWRASGSWHHDLYWPARSRPPRSSVATTSRSSIGRKTPCTMLNEASDSCSL